MNRILCRLFGHHTVRVPGMLVGFPDEFVCLRCYDRAPMRRPEVAS